MNGNSRRIVSIVPSKLFLAGAFAAALLVALPSAQATPLTAAQTILAVPGISPAGATPVTAPLFSNFTSPTFSGTLTSQVFTADPTNIYGLGALTFTYLIHNDAVSSDGIERFTVNGFSSFATVDATFQGGGPGSAPTRFSRSIAGPGEVFGSLFDTPSELLPGATSALIVVQVPTNVYFASIASIIDGSVAGNIPTYAPSPFNPVPEPSSLVLLAMGSMAAAAIRFRRK